MLIHDEDIAVSEPLEVADDYLNRAGCIAPSDGNVPVITGFTRVTRIFRILSRVLSLIRTARRPETKDLLNLQFYVEQIDDIKGLLEAEIERLPAPLDIMVDPQGDRADPALCATSDVQGFETCKANILVTQALARFELLQLAAILGVPGQLDATIGHVLRKLDL